MQLPRNHLVSGRRNDSVDLSSLRNPLVQEEARLQDLILCSQAAAVH